MTQKYSLSADTRSITGRKVKNLRKQGLLPAVVYGANKEPSPISLSSQDFNRIYKEAGSSSLIELSLGDEKINVIAQDPHYDPVSGNLIHVDLIRVRMDKKIRTEIPLEFTGESLAVEQEKGTLVTPYSSLEVECLPRNLVPEIKVDISPLKTFEDQIKISDIDIPEGIEIFAEPEDVIALVEPPRSEEELAELETSTEEQEKEALEKVAGEPEEEKDADAKEESNGEGDETKNSDV
ncbi:MAG TPA: 50S ribosomal protein L25 [bacterium]|nr:50S ribosomal protein L25 [bacterium]HPL56209.1 50S ribosomal protein L25 [bacterium]